MKSSLELGCVDAVAPHDHGVLTVVGVVPAAAANRLETEALVQPDRVVVGVAHLQRDPARTKSVGTLHESREEDGAVPLRVVPGANADGGDMGFERDAPEARVADEPPSWRSTTYDACRFWDSSLAYAFFGHGDAKTWRSIACTAAMSS